MAMAMIDEDEKQSKAEFAHAIERAQREEDALRFQRGNTSGLSMLSMKRGRDPGGVGQTPNKRGARSASYEERCIGLVKPPIIIEVIKQLQLEMAQGTNSLAATHAAFYLSRLNGFHHRGMCQQCLCCLEQ
jgi:hypothetical protein